MSFLAAYRTNILDRTPITYRDIRVGDVLEFRYKNKKDNVSKLRVVLVVNIFPVIGSWKDRKVHAFSLPEMAPGVFYNMDNWIYEYGIYKLLFNRSTSLPS